MSRLLCSSTAWMTMPLRLTMVFSFEQPESQRTLSDIITKFDAFAMGEMNVTYERYLFNSGLQRERESFEIFYSDLRRLVKSCNYCERCLDSLLRDRIVLGVRDKDTQRDLLSRDLTLAKAIDVCKVAENADRHRQKINMAPEASAAVNALPEQKNRPLSSSTRPQSSSKPPQAAKCKFCGRQHLMLKSKCPAHGKECSKFMVGTTLPVCASPLVAESSTSSPQTLKLIVLQGWPDLKSDLPSCVLPYFNYRDELTDGKPLGFASQTLSEAERNYAQIEKELLAVIFGMNKFYHYTFARPVTVVTDHKPLISIANKPLSKAPKRLQSMFLKLQAFDFNLIYKRGAQLNVSDSLSRAPLPTVNAVHTCSNISHCPFKDSRLSEIKAATVLDPVLLQLKLIVLQGWPDLNSDLPSCVLPYFNYLDELTVQHRIILRGDRNVIPSSLCQDLKAKVRAGHHGINSCLRRARDLIFWPCIVRYLCHVQCAPT
ncbi:hypothetical protein EGW08_023603 [Elysia chlorotica]|uniref:Reverse transcriptase RNase H-like domain-containing protein n=1 Tax=Elysia chlorotica TaxID=188477 RepID=A0A3S0Z7E4_ELYCH|nr:hypothetical protein EGW08_023603 [Elysia chlorotica]